LDCNIIFIKYFFFKTNIDYSGASLTFARIGYTSSGGVYGTTGNPNPTIQAYPKQPFATINWSVDVGINL
jgi:hypothetical protein